MLCSLKPPPFASPTTRSCLCRSLWSQPIVTPWHSFTALWQEFKLDTPIESLRMWKRNAPPLTSVVYMKFCGFFPNVKPETLLPLLSEPTRRGWDPNYEVFDVVERKNDGSSMFSIAAVCW